MPLILGIDLGSSSVKACLLNSDTGRPLAEAESPGTEMEISSPSLGWAEQDPELWWHHLRISVRMLKKAFNFIPADVKAVGVSYQMHGLVLVDRKNRVLRPAIIWCDSRAFDAGEKAQKKIGRAACFQSLLNLPGNFTASKLRWVMDNEPEIYRKVHRFMLPGDYLAMRMTGLVRTTAPGLSEGIFWDFKKREVSRAVMEAFGFSPKIFPPVVPTFSRQGTLTAGAAEELGLTRDAVVSYRAGDQPNNAFSLKVLSHGEVAAAAGTSGVVYAVSEKRVMDKKSRLNVFSHVNDSSEARRLGVLLCVNGAGILYGWLRRNIAKGADYNKLNCLGMEIPPGAGGVMCFPFGNGAERTLGNADPGAAFSGVRFNCHDERHLIRAAQEGVVFALNYGIEIMKEAGLDPSFCRAGLSNMFLSKLFRTAFTNTSGLGLELYRTGGAQGAARGAGVGSEIFASEREAFRGLEPDKTEQPSPGLEEAYGEAYGRWKSYLEEKLLG